MPEEHIAEAILRRVLDPESADHYNALCGKVWDTDCRVELAPEQVEYMRSLGLRDV